MRNGSAAHDNLTRDILDGSDKRCFVACYALGEDHEDTQVLRVWRDRHLSQNKAGRAFITIYYALSPWVIKIAAPIPGFKRLSARCVSALAKRVNE